jgi:hypothetical protein
MVEQLLATFGTNRTLANKAVMLSGQHFIMLLFERIFQGIILEPQT